MGKSLWVGMFFACVIVAVAVSQREVTADSIPSEDDLLPPPEATPPQPAPAPGAQRPIDPFSTSDVGPPSGVWQYEDLGPEEQEAADRGFETSTWAGGQQALAAAAAQRYPEIAAKRAQLMLGILELADTGVVP